MGSRDSRPISWIKAARKAFDAFPQGARVDILESLTIAAEGDGYIAVMDGGRVTSGHGVIANSNVSKGFVGVYGSGATWIADELSIGRSGTGTLAIYGGVMLILNIKSIAAGIREVLAASAQRRNSET